MPDPQGSTYRSHFGVRTTGDTSVCRRRTTRQVVLDALQTRLKIALAPTRGLDATNVQSQSNVLVLQALRAQQHDACTQGQTYARQLGANQIVEQLALSISTPIRSTPLAWRDSFKFRQECITSLN